MISKDWEIQLQQLRAELILFKESIRETSDDIIREGFSQYPIFIAHTSEIDLGEVILDKNDMNTYWSISASTLESFVEKNVIPEDKAILFKENYKDAKEYICFFVVHGAEARFAYVPYQSSNISNN